MPFRWMPAQGNLLALCGESALSFSTSLDSLTPAGNMIDGRPSTGVRFGTKGVSPTVACDLNLLRNGGFETDDGLASWTVLSGTSVRTTAAGEPFDGVAALKFTSAGVRYQDILIPSGIPFLLSAALQSDGDVAAEVAVLNLDTGHFLDDSGAWVADSTARALSTTSMTYVEQAQPVIAEPLSITGRYLTRLRVHLSALAADMFFDVVALRPAWNFLGIFGHNLTARGGYREPEPERTESFIYYGQVPRYRIVTEDMITGGWIVPGGPESFDDGQSFAVPAPNTWNAWASPKGAKNIEVTISSDQYLNYPLPSFGELVLGYVEPLAPAGFPVGVKLAEAGQVRNESVAGDLYAYNAGPRALRELSLRFTYDSAEAEESIRDRLYAVSRGGANGLILVPPDDMIASVGLIFGVPEADLGYSLEARTTGPAFVRTASLVIRELPGPEGFDE